MAGTKRGMPYERTGPFPIDDTFVLSKAEMLAVDDTKMPDVYFAACKDDGKMYTYDKSATASAETGKFSVVEGGDAGHMELTQAEYTALPEEEKMNGTTYFITDGGAYVPAVDLIPYVNQAPIVVGKFDLRGDGEFRDIKRVRLWISDLKNANKTITAGWTETGVYIRTLRVYGAFTFHHLDGYGVYRIYQLPIPYTMLKADGTIKFNLNFYVDELNKLIMDIYNQSAFHQDDFAQVIIDYIETPIT